MKITKFDNILFGGDYCPEQWDEKTWLEDMRILKLYGVNTVTINIFGWIFLEPEDGKYDFSLLDKVVNLVTENGFQIAMGTGSAAPPNWLLQKYPGIMRVDEQRRQTTLSKRTAYCTNNEDYRREIRNLCTKLAEHYKNQENIIIWHLFNEPEVLCYCETCTKKYQQWLKDKYGSLENLNKVWNTSIWGHIYTDWDQIEPPTILNQLQPPAEGDDWGRGFFTYPTEAIDYRRFQSESLRDCLAVEADAIKTVIPDAVTTINFQTREFDYKEMVKGVDVASLDTYPLKGADPALNAFNCHTTRGLKDPGEPFLIMEMSPNHGSWAPVCSAKRPGEVQFIAVSNIAYGSDSAMFFQLRRSISGFEKYHGAMISHSGHENTRIGKELTELGDTLKALSHDIPGSKIRSDVALIFDWQSRWGVRVDIGPQKDMDYEKELFYYYKFFYDRNISVDFVTPDMDLSKYKVVVAPILYMIGEKEIRNIKDFVNNGGTFISTYYSGLLDYDGHVYLGGYPGAFRDLFGIHFDETDALPLSEGNTVVPQVPWLDADDRECKYLFDLIQTDGAKVIGTYGQDFYKGMACITENKYGEGTAVYVGSRPSRGILDALFDHYMECQNVRGVLITPQGVSAAMRYGENARYLFLMNDNFEERTVDISRYGKCRSLITGKDSDKVILKGKGVDCLIVTN